MSLLAAVALPLLRGAAVAALLAGLADGWALALGGGSGSGALALGALLLATGWGACHRGSARPPARASYLWLAIGGCAMPMLSAWAPWAGLAGALYVLPLRVLGARCSSFLEASDRPAAHFGGLAFGALLGAAWSHAAGLGFGGFVLVAVLAGLLTAGAPAENTAAETDDTPPWSRAAQRAAGLGFGAGAVWAWALLAPALRAHDASDAGADLRAALTLAAIALIAWFTLGAFLAEHRSGPVLLALAAAATGAVLPLTVSTWLGWSDPSAFDALLRLPALRSLFGSGAPRLPEEHFAYVPLLIVLGCGLPLLLGVAALRGWLGRTPSGPYRLAPLLLGAGFALGASALPVFGGDGGPRLAGTLAVPALAAVAAIAALICAPGSFALRGLLAAAAAAAAIFFARSVPDPRPAFPMQDARDWSVSAARDGARLQADARGATWRVVGTDAMDGARLEFLARGRNLLTPELDDGGVWTREFDVALAHAPGAKRLLLVGAPHPATLRAAARAGVAQAVVAGDGAALRLLRARDPDGYGLEVGGAESVARARGEYDLILLRSQALWDEDLPLLRAGVVAQAARRLAPGGFCCFALGPEQLPDGALPGVLASWREIFPRVALYVVPDGLRGARLLIAAAAHLEGEWPPELAPLRTGGRELELIAGHAARAALAPPLPRIRASLAATRWRLVDELAPQRRAARLFEGLVAALEGEPEGPAPSLLRAYAAQYAAQEYSVHDTYLEPGPEATEVDRGALEELGRLARAHPDSAWVQALWDDAARTLAWKREIGLIEEFARPLREQLGWRTPGLTLALARAAAEMLDEEEALALIAEVLAARPDDPEALALMRAVNGEEPLAPDAHAGHGHR